MSMTINKSFFMALCVAALLSATTVKANGDEKAPWYSRGQVYGTVFANFHYQLTEEEGDQEFEVNRAYLGYKMELEKGFSGDIKLDIGSPSDVSSTSYSLKRRFAFFKNAYLQYQKDKLTLQFGIADCQQFKIQEKFWGNRYIYHSFQDKYKFGPSADIGIFAQYKLSDKINLDASFSNGEGYATTQADEFFKASIGSTFTLFNKLTLRAYYDLFTTSVNNQSTIATFAGIKLSKFSLGAEFNYQLNNNFVNDHDMYGYSVYGSYSLKENWKLFGRYDQLYSNTLSGDEVAWNIGNDGSALLAGVEYQPIKSVRLSLNYQDWLSYAKNGDDTHYIYLNLQYSF